MKQKIFLAAAGLTLAVAACKKPDDTPIAGKGGNATLRIYSQHHRPPAIDSITVYIKYNAVDLPTTFDDSAVAVKTATDTVATFSGLKKGNYYIYGRGWDRNIRDTVTGGTPYTITEEKVIDLKLAVTEGD